MKKNTYNCKKLRIRNARIIRISNGDKLSYRPQVQLNFLGIKYFKDVHVDYDEGYWYYWKNVCATAKEAFRTLQDYELLLGCKLLIKNK